MPLAPQLKARRLPALLAGVFLLLGSAARSETKPPCGPTGTGQPCPPSQLPADPTRPGAEPEPEPIAPADRFSQAPPGGTESAGVFNPQVIGDLLASQICGPIIAFFPDGTRAVLAPGSFPVIPRGTRLNVDFFVGGLRIPAGTPFPADTPSNQATPATPACPGAAVLARSSYKIAENESPRPQDRVFVTYNYFNNLNDNAGTFDGGRIDAHRELIGFEKTFLDGDASFGLRLPILQVGGNDGLEDSGIGDLTFILKFALINDLHTGNVLSTGLAVTAPTGHDFTPPGSPSIRPAVLQPYVGGILNFGDAYVQGFSSVAFPTDDDDVIYWFNDVSAGYKLYRAADCNSLISSLTPAAEVHVNTPLNHRGSRSLPIPGIDIVNLTGGLFVGVGQRSLLAVGVVAPVTGPQVFDFEAFVQFNFRF